MPPRKTVKVTRKPTKETQHPPNPTTTSVEKPVLKKTTKIKEKMELDDNEMKLEEQKENTLDFDTEDQLEEEIGEVIPRSSTIKKILDQKNNDTMEIDNVHEFDFIIPNTTKNGNDNLKLFVCKDHDRGALGGSQPSSIIVAKNEEEAKEFLNIQLIVNRLKPHDSHPFTLILYPLYKSRAFILSGTPLNEMTRDMDYASSQFTPNSNPSLFICKDHWSQWPIPPVSIVISENEKNAKYLLNQELQIRGMKTNQELPFSFENYDLSKSFAMIISLGQPGGNN